MWKKTTEKRRSTAAQFFMDDEEPLAVDVKSVYDKVVELMNQASLLQKASDKVTNLKKAQDLIIHKEPDLLDNFMDEMLAFQQDRSVDVRRFVVGFIEEACKRDPEIFPQLIANVKMMLNDEAVAVVKRVIQSAVQLYKYALAWICNAKVVTDMMESTWLCITEIKTKIITMIDSDNDGVRTHAIKFLEMLVIVQTYPESDCPRKSGLDINLEDIPFSLKFMKPTKLEAEARNVFDVLVKFHGSPHISSINLMACMGSLTTIAKCRPEFLVKVIQAFEALQVNLPPTLARSQVISVRKQLKLQLLTLLKQPSSVNHHPQITTLLVDLGATEQEVQRSIPKLDESNSKKRTRASTGTDEATTAGSSSSSSKRSKTSSAGDEHTAAPSDDDKPSPKTATNTAIDITARHLVPLMTAERVVRVVTASMAALPDVMPDHFELNYTPIAAAGTAAQIEHLSRLLATQLTAVGIGPGVDEVGRLKVESEAEKEKAPKPIQTVVGGQLVEEKTTTKSVTPLIPNISTKFSKRPGVRQLKLSEFTRPLSREQSKKLSHAALLRILNAERAAFIGGASHVRTKVLSWLVTYFNGDHFEQMLEFIFEDVRGRAELLFMWLYEEYANYQGFSHLADTLERAGSSQYNRTLCAALNGLLERSEQKDREILFVRIFMEAPTITDGAIEVLKVFCQDESRVMVGIGILKDLVVKRPTKQMEFLAVILELTGHERAEVRNQPIKIAKQLHEREELQPAIEGHALMHLKFLLMSEPPSVLFGETLGRALKVDTWTEDITRVCLHLYLVLLPVNHKLVHDLAQVYVATSPDIKRMILRVLENPVKGMGMNSPELLTLVESCPKGAETLVTRIIHILTDRTPPSAELVARVRDLYHKRVPDVRFLIPVLNGLLKKEVVAALPKLIKLNPVVVKEVFNRLLGGHGDAGVNYSSPLTPAELLVALHNIDTTKCDMKTIIKATSMCFGEKHIYTQEVLAVVMQQLMEQNPLPTLLMRTVLQSLSLYPRLIGFVMNILQRLILKQVWKHKKVWEGFVKCCQRTKPQSFQVLLQLPAAQLQNVFETCPEVREPLLAYVDSFTQNQRAHIPKNVMNVLAGVNKENKDVDVATELDDVNIKQEMVIKEEPIDVDVDEEGNNRNE